MRIASSPPTVKAVARIRRGSVPSSAAMGGLSATARSLRPQSVRWAARSTSAMTAIAVSAHTSR